MTGTMKFISHGAGAQAGPMGTSDMSGVVHELQKITQFVAVLADRNPELRLPLPEFHNEINVPSPRIDVHVPSVENRIEVVPTPISVNVEAPRVENHFRSDPHVELDASRVVFALYVLSGVIGVSTASAIAALLLH